MKTVFRVLTSFFRYFPTYQGYADGGLFANNPSLSAVGRAYAHFPLVRPENTVVLSLGTGHCLKELRQATHTTSLDWGLQQWAPQLLDLLMEANQLSNEVNLKLLLKSRYHRIDTEIASTILLDSVDAMDELICIADTVDLSEAEHWIRTTFMGSEFLDLEVPPSPGAAGVEK